MRPTEIADIARIPVDTTGSRISERQARQIAYFVGSGGAETALITLVGSPEAVGLALAAISATMAEFEAVHGRFKPCAGCPD